MVEAVAILGPTASGKSALAIRLFKNLDIEIISLDSALIYRGMDIGTAKPSVSELTAVPHHLIDICDPKDSYSAADFRNDCIALVDKIHSRGALPVICGGTMMYYKALTEGLSPLPHTTEQARKTVAMMAKELGWQALHEKLQQIDPQSYERLDPNDGQRISRALEIFVMTGKPMSSFFKQRSQACPFAIHEFVLLPQTSRQELMPAIERRFDEMLSSGLVEEVSRLKKRGDLTLDLPSMRCVGYRQVWQYLDGAYGYDEMRKLSIIATGHLAKHQLTWLKGALGQALPSGSRTKLDIGDKDNLLKVLLKLQELKLYQRYVKV